MRTHYCGLVTEALIGQTVTVCGWADVARNLGGLCFIDLRDHEGIVQVVAEVDTARPETTAASLQGFINAQHGRMPDFSLSVRDRNDLTAYILGLHQ